MAPVPSETEAVTATVAAPSGALLVMLSAIAQDALESTLDRISAAFPDRQVAIAAPDLSPNAVESFGPNYPSLHLLTDAVSAAPAGAWVLTAADFLNVYKAAQQHGASFCLLLGPEAHSLGVEALRGTVRGGCGRVRSCSAALRAWAAGRPGKFGAALPGDAGCLWRFRRNFRGKFGEWSRQISAGRRSWNVSADGFAAGRCSAKVYRAEPE